MPYTNYIQKNYNNKKLKKEKKEKGSGDTSLCHLLYHSLLLLLPSLPSTRAIGMASTLFTYVGEKIHPHKGSEVEISTSTKSW
jgi:hypothetical protein